MAVCLLCCSLVGFILLLLVYRFFLRSRFLAWFIHKQGQHKCEETERVKKELFSCLNDIVSADPVLQQQGRFTLLEVGTGHGANLKYYPSNADLILTDPNPHFESSLRAGLESHPHLKSCRRYQASGEDLSIVGDVSIDVVVITHVFCIVSDPRKVVEEIKRVLVPGGKLVFFDHVEDHQNRVTRFLQNLLTESGVWPFIFGGSKLNRNPDIEMRKAGFSQVTSERRNVGHNEGIFGKLGVVKMHAYGTATK